MKSTACRLTSSHGVMNYPRAVPPNTRTGSQQFSRRASAVDQSQQQLWPAQHQENKAHRPEFIRDQRPSLKSIEPKGSVVAVILGFPQLTPGNWSQPFYREFGDGPKSQDSSCGAALGNPVKISAFAEVTLRRIIATLPAKIDAHRRCVRRRHSWLIDIPMSNLINSGVNKIYILAQYQSTSLNHYLNATYNFQASGIPLGGDGYMEVVSATQVLPSDQIYHMDFCWLVEAHRANDPDVLPSDQIYHMDFCRLVEAHRANDADMTIVCRTASASAADHLGIVKIGGGTCQIDKFREKPKGVELTGMSMSWDEIDAYLHSGFTSEEDEPEEHEDGERDYVGSCGIYVFLHEPEEHEDGERTYVGSCGIYVFKREALEKLLEDKDIKDIGRDLIPAAVAGCYNVVAANMDGYWADIGGSIKDYYDFSMSLVLPDPPFSFIHKHGRQIFAHPEKLGRQILAHPKARLDESVAC
eukprot:gene22221-29285_t